MKTILVTGANGQLGNSIRLLAGETGGGFGFLFTDVDTLDICNKELFLSYARAKGVEYVVNCAAYTAVDGAEDNEALALQINGEAVRKLGEACRSAAIRLIHISTDYVFDGTNSLPYVENDYACPLSVYGRSKRMGEVFLQDVCPEALILRTSWLYSAFGNNFVKTMLRLGKEREELRVVFDQVGAPTYAADLASAILSIVRSAEEGNFRSGLFHYSNEGVCSWYDFARKILQLAHARCRVLPIETKDYPSRAARPQYSVLNKRKIKQTYGLQIPHWEDSLQGAINRIKD